MSSSILIVLIILATLLLCAIIFIPLIIYVSKKMRRHVLYDYNGHKIEVFTYMTSAKFVVDGQLIDSGSRMGQNYNYQFVHKIDNDVIKVFINMVVASPEIKLYINDEKQNINY